MPGGRTPHPLWGGFIRNDSNPKNVKATCKKCGIVIMAIIERMRKHARQCENVKIEEDEQPAMKKPNLTQ